jgi:hypothetical protein
VHPRRPPQTVQPEGIGLSTATSLARALAPMRGRLTLAKAEAEIRDHGRRMLIITSPYCAVIIDSVDAPYRSRHAQPTVPVTM